MTPAGEAASGDVTNSQSSTNGLYAAPRRDVRHEDCIFYHTMDIPGIGTVEGQWDLRGREPDYIGNVLVRGKRVLDVGAASGFFTFYFERQGADVIAYDLSDAQPWDVVPYRAYDFRSFEANRRTIMRRVNDSFWLAHQALKSKSRVVYGTVYDIPKELGEVDISFFGSILLHTRDPFRALQSAADITKEAIVVTEVLREDLGAAPVMRFVPNAETIDPKETWWTLTPDIVTQFLHVLGFANTKVTLHTQQSQFGPSKFFTVVGRRMLEARVSNPGLLSRAARTLRNGGPVEFSRQTVHYLTRAARLQRAPAEKKQISSGDGLPIPPPDLIFLAVGRREADPYLRSGAEVAETIRTQLAKNGIDLGDCGNVLDFGCGAGRILRHYGKVKGPHFYGIDYNPAVIDWARENLRFANFATNTMDGLLPYVGGQFDLIYCFSVFTHMPEEAQQHWIGELRRVIRPGGYLYVTTHGLAYLSQIPSELHASFKAGKLVVINSEASGKNDCGAFHPESYVRTAFAPGFAVVDFFPSEYPQDAYLLRKSPDTYGEPGSVLLRST